MIPAELLQAKLSNWKPEGAGRQNWSEDLAGTGWALGLAADRADSMSCLLWELALVRNPQAAEGEAELRAFATGIAARAGSGLMEPLRVYEIDPTLNTAILRSTSPAKRGEQVSYYELRLDGTNTAKLRRYQTAPATTNQREQVAFAITFEALSRLVEDITRG